MSLWRNFVLLFLPLTIVVPFLVFLGVSQQRETLRTVVSERDEKTARAAAAAMSEQLNSRAQLVRGIAEQAAVSDDAELLLNSIGFLEAQFQGGLAIFSLSGVPLAIRGVNRDSVIDWPRFETTTSPFSDPIFDPQTGNLIALVRATNESVQVVGAYDPIAMAQDVLASALDTTQAIDSIVVDSEQRVVFQSVSTESSSTSQSESTLTTSQQFGVTQALNGTAGAIFAAEDDERVIAYSPIDPLGWAIVTEEDLTESNAQVSTALVFTPLLLGVVLFFALGVIWFNDRQVVRPLQVLEKRAAAVGRGNFAEVGQDVGGIDAIRKLHDEFVSMANRLEMAQGNLRSQVGAITLGQEEERRRLARELHDDTIQSLIALNQQIHLAQLRGDGSVSAELETMQSMLAGIIQDVRQFTQALRPIGLEELGLIPALELLIENSELKAGFPITLDQRGVAYRLPMNKEFALYRCVQEALNNLIQHADASAGGVEVHFEETQTKIIVEDDGKGFLPPSNLSEMALVGNFGLLGIHERAELIDATVDIEAAQGEGTKLTIWVTRSPS